MRRILYLVAGLLLAAAAVLLPSMYAACQIVFESMREDEVLMINFMKVSMLISALVLLGALILCGLIVLVNPFWNDPPMLFDVIGGMLLFSSVVSIVRLIIIWPIKTVKED